MHGNTSVEYALVPSAAGGLLITGGIPDRHIERAGKSHGRAWADYW